MSKLKLETLMSFELVLIEVEKEGFGVKKGVYCVGEDIDPSIATRLLNNKNAKIKEISKEQVKNETDQQPQTQISDDPVESPTTSEDVETWASDGDDEDRVEEIRLIERPLYPTGSRD